MYPELIDKNLMIIVFYSLFTLVLKRSLKLVKRLKSYIRIAEISIIIGFMRQISFTKIITTVPQA